MLCAVNKQAVAASFSRHANHYQQHAQLQQQTAAELLRLLQSQFSVQSNTQIAQQKASYLLDLGCGPGINAAALQPLAQHYMGVDIAFGMLHSAQELLCSDAERNRHLLQADMEQLPLANESIDILYSNLAVQWCSDPARLVTELARVLQPNTGIAAISTVLPNSLQPLAQLRAEYHGSAQVRGQHTWPQWLVAAEQAGLNVCLAYTKPITAYFSSLRELLQSISKVGASVAVGGGHALSRQELRYLQRTYHHYEQPQGLPLTYQIGYLVLQKQRPNG